MRAATWLLCLLVAGCDTNPFAPDPEFVNRRPLDPLPDWYATEYALMEECAGLRGDFVAVRWYIADLVVFRGRHLAGMVDFPHDITFSADHYANRFVVRHEAEHHIRQMGDEIHLSNGATPCQGYVPPGGPL